MSGTEQKDAIFDISMLACLRSHHWDVRDPEAWLTLINHAHAGTWVMETGVPELVPEIADALRQQGYIAEEAEENGIGIIVVQYPTRPTTRRFSR